MHTVTQIPAHTYVYTYMHICTQTKEKLSDIKQYPYKSKMEKEEVRTYILIPTPAQHC